MFFRNFIDETELYSERQSDGRIAKQINFNFPVYYNGNRSLPAFLFYAHNDFSNTSTVVCCIALALKVKVCNVVSVFVYLS